MADTLWIKVQCARTNYFHLTVHFYTSQFAVVILSQTLQHSHVT